MTHTIVQANLIAAALNLAFAIVAMVIGLTALKIIDRFIFPEIDFVEEIKKGNIAAAITAGMGVFFMAMLLGNAVR
jgi:uncharacterized membrane protein YjfL (UPF0719 family)